MLPPELEAHRWMHWSGELATTSNGGIDPAGTATLVINSLADAFGRESSKRILASIVACQEQKKIRFVGTSLTSAKDIFGKRLVGTGDL